MYLRKTMMQANRYFVGRIRLMLDPKTHIAKQLRHRCGTR